MQQKRTLQSRVGRFDLCASHPKAKEGILPSVRQHMLCNACRNSAGFGSYCHYRSTTPICFHAPNYCLNTWARQEASALPFSVVAATFLHNLCQVTLKLGWIH